MSDLLHAIFFSGPWTAFRDWFFSLGEQYGVDPIIFGSISVGAIPFL